MPKLKSKSGARKRFSLSGGGRVKRNHAYHRHNLTKKTQKQKRRLRARGLLAAPDARIVRRFLPYA